MKRIISAGIATAALLGFIGQASAADMARPLPTKAPAYVQQYYNWTGGYAGINGGGGWGSSNSIDSSGGVFGGTLGYNWQAGQGVFGIETDIQWSGIEGDGNIGGVVPITAGSDWFGTVRGRIGYAWDRVMLYGTGGLAYGNIHANSPFGSADTTNAGWALGAGVEFALAGPWTAKVEYLHVDLGDTNVAGVLGSTNVDFNADIIRAGLNYRF